MPPSDLSRRRTLCGMWLRAKSKLLLNCLTQESLPFNARVDHINPVLPQIIQSHYVRISLCGLSLCEACGLAEWKSGTHLPVFW